MKVEIVKGTVAGGSRVKPGDTPEVSEAEARLLINSGKAVEYVEKPKRGRPKKTDSD